MTEPLDIDLAGPVDLAGFKANRAEMIRHKAVMDTVLKLYSHQLARVQEAALQEGTVMAALELANIRISALQAECKRLKALVPTEGSTT